MSYLTAREVGYNRDQTADKQKENRCATNSKGGEHVHAT